jgi:apoptosis-inducing factor 3
MKKYEAKDFLSTEPMLLRLRQPLGRLLPTHSRSASSVVSLDRLGRSGRGSRESQTSNSSVLAVTAGIGFSSVVFAKNLSSCESKKEVSIGQDSDYGEGELYEVSVGDDRQVLITRQEGKLYAIGSRCSHYGYPLAKGVKCGNEVVCALHDAAFDIKTGKVIRGPGLDGLPTYAIRVGKNKEVFVTVPVENFPGKVPLPLSKRDPKNKTTYVIVGGGAAGMAAAETLRQEGFTGRVVLISKEAHLPYDRPVLSKKLPVKGKIDGLYLRSQEYYTNGDIETMLGVEVEKIDTEKKCVKFSGSEIAYDKVLVATGGQPRELFLPGTTSRNVLMLRTLDDAIAINEFAAEKGQKIVIIGGSFIGMELASTLIQKGVDVTIVSKTSVPYERVLGKKVGAFFANLLAERDIKYIGNTSAKILRTDPTADSSLVHAVELDEGDVLPADAVVIGAGVIPNCAGLIESGGKLKLAVDGSIPVDPFLESRGVKGLYAAGDICSFPYVKNGGADLRVEHWDVAIQQGRTAARNMLGKNIPYNEVPYFWTMIFGKSLRYVGNVGSEGVTFDNVLIEGDLAKGEFVAYYVKKDRIAAVATVGRDPVAAACAELFRRGDMPSPAEIQLGTVNAQSLLERIKRKKIN